MNRSLVRWEIVLSDVELISLVQANHSAVMPSRLEPFKREVNLSASALLPTGITIIEYRFEDSSNNVAFCRFHVEISEYDSKVTSNSGTFNEHTITSAVTAASSTLSTVINRDDYSTDKYENMKTSALTSASLLPSRMSTSLASLTLLSSLISSSSLLPSQLPSSSSSLSSSSLSSSPSSSSPPFSPSSSTPSSSSLSSSPPPPLSQSSPSSLSSSAFTSLSSSSPSYSSLLTSSSPTPSSSASSSSSSESLSSSISSPATASSSSASSPAASPSSSTTSSSSASSSLPSKAFSFQSVTDTVFNTLYFTTQMETVDTIGQETLINDQENVDQLSTDQQLTDVYHSTDPQPTGFTDRRPHDQHTYHQQNGKNQTNAGSTDQRPAVEQPTTNERLTKQQDSTRQQPTHQPTINSHITLFEQLSTEVTVDSEQFPTTADSTGGDSRLQTENVDHTSLPTEPNEVSNSNNPYGTTEDDLYNPTSPYNLMTSRLAVGSKNANITGTAVITMVIISLCTIGGLSFLVIITIVIIKKKQVDKSSTTNRHSSNARRLDFENPAYKIYDLQNLDKECGVSRSGESLSNCEKVSRF